MHAIPEKLRVAWLPPVLKVRVSWAGKVVADGPIRCEQAEHQHAARGQIPPARRSRRSRPTGEYAQHVIAGYAQRRMDLQPFAAHLAASYPNPAAPRDRPYAHRFAPFHLFDGGIA